MLLFFELAIQLLVEASDRVVELVVDVADFGAGLLHLFIGDVLIFVLVETVVARRAEPLHKLATGRG